jgi:hypothetical protein
MRRVEQSRNALVDHLSTALPSVGSLKIFARVLQTVVEILGGWVHFARFALYNRAPIRGVADI